MASIVDERGYNQGFVLNNAQATRLNRRAESIVKALPRHEGTPIRLLELGCGTGELANMIASLTSAVVTGVDLSMEFVLAARRNFKKSNLDFQQLDLTTAVAGCAPDAYHAIVGNGILHHLYYRLDPALEMLREWLLPGGRLIFWEPNLLNPYVWSIFTIPRLRLMARLEPDEMAFTASFIRAKLARGGYCNIKVSTRDFLLPITPRPLIRINTLASEVLDRTPLINRWAQSLFIVAQR
jgi:SAM-dependent methyltransferase